MVIPDLQGRQIGYVIISQRTYMHYEQTLVMSHSVRLRDRVNASVQLVE
jgi:hypothetical protein